MTEPTPPEVHTNGGVSQPDTVIPPSKRQRRPSVRLGDIGGDQQLYESTNHLNRSRPKQPQWNTTTNKSSTSSKIKPLFNLTTNPTPTTNEYIHVVDSQDNNNGAKTNLNLDSAGFSSWKLSNSTKSKRGGPAATKRVRSNWRDSSSKTDEEEDNKFVSDDDDVGFRDFDRDGSDSGLKEQSPIQSHGNFVVGHKRRDVRVRVSDGVELDGPSDTDGRNSDRNGVRDWLNELGLGRYAPVFEIHEVDDEVLPLLTLEDLKDMGINAVGSRRKMYCSIQKLGKGFS